MPVNSFRFSVRLVRVDYWLFPFTSAWRLGPTIFVMTSGYSVTEKVLLVRERHLLANWETDIDDNCLNTNRFLTCELQWHSDSTAVMSHSQQYDRVIW